MTTENIISILLSSNYQWNRMNDQPCIHAFHDKYYINLCLWNPRGIPTISIDVDDVQSGLDDIVSLNIQEGQNSFEELLNLYNSWKNNANNIAA